MPDLKRLIHEIHRRSLWQVLGIYAASGWIVLGAVGTLAESLGLPEWAPRFALFLMIIGLPIVLATAFVQEGIRSRVDAGGPGVDAGSAPAATGNGETSAAGLKARLTWRRALFGGLVAFSLLFGFAGLWVILGDRNAERRDVETADAVEADPAVAVLPFTFRGVDLDMWGEGMVDLLSPMVDGVAGLRAINNRTVLARWAERVSEGEAADLETSLEVARAAGARYALVGSGIVSGETARLDLDLYDTRSGERIDRAQVEGPADDMLAVVDRAAAETVRAVLEAQGRISDFKLARLTDSPEALVAFLEGEVAARAFRNVEAWDAYTRAVEIDTAFAFAHLRFPLLAQWGATVLRPTGRHWDAAARHLDRLDERSTLRVRAHEADGEERLRLRREAVARFPDDATLWYDLAEDLIHGSTGFPTRDEIEGAFRQALDLEPEQASFYPHLVGIAFAKGDEATARALATRFRDLSIEREGSYTTDLDPRVGPFAVDLAFGTETERAAARAAIDTLPPDFILATAAFMGGAPLQEALETTLLEAFDHPDSGATAGTPGADASIHSVAGRWLVIKYALWDGRPSRAWEFFEGDVLGFTTVRRDSRALAYQIHSLGVPAPEGLLEAEFGADHIDPASHAETVFTAGAIAADQGRWGDYDRALSELERRTGSAGAVDLLTSYGAWRRGDLETAIAGFERRHDNSRIGQWWLGDAYMEAGRWVDAERVFASWGWNEWHEPFSEEPLAQRRLGEVYEALDRPGDAAAAYAYFLEHWEDADPELQPLVEATRSRLEAILAEIG